MNLFNKTIQFRFNMDNVSQIHQYLFLPSEGNLTSSFITLNGEKLQMVNDTTLPTIEPRIKKPNSDLFLPAKSLSFYVLPDLKASACIH